MRSRELFFSETIGCGRMINNFLIICANTNPICNVRRKNMTGEEFVQNCFIEKDRMLDLYFDKAKDTLVGGQIKNIVANGISERTVRSLLDSVMNEVFYTMLLGLDGETSLGNVQMTYKLFDEDGNQLEDIESYAFDSFMAEEDE